MFRLWGKREKFCDGLSRRGFLQVGAFGAGLTLADLLRGQATAAHSTPTKSAIMIYLPGGPSHMDMYDLKPEAPAEFRGEFKPIQTNVPGVQISEHFPRQARMWDKLAAVRSLYAVDEHSDDLVMSGHSAAMRRNDQHPSFGAVMSKLRGSSADVPPYVSFYGYTGGQEPGFLGASYRAFSPQDQGMQNLRLASGVDLNRFDDRRSLLTSLDGIRRDLDTDGTLRGLDSFTSRAFDMVTSGTVRKALDLTREEPRSRDRYQGIENFLMARRLIEAGVGCVTLAYGGWDTHSSNFKTLRNQLPVIDRAVANLVEDLHDRGMSNDVSLVMWGEFGRTPRVNGNDGGRDHWSPAMSALVAGGGMKMGQMIGATSARGEYPVDRKYSASQLLSTLYRAAGIDPSQTLTNGSGRPIYILDDREPVTELL